MPAAGFTLLGRPPACPMVLVNTTALIWIVNNVGVASRVQNFLMRAGEGAESFVTITLAGRLITSTLLLSAVVVSAKAPDPHLLSLVPPDSQIVAEAPSSSMIAPGRFRGTSFNSANPGRSLMLDSEMRQGTRTRCVVKISRARYDKWLQRLKAHSFGIGVCFKLGARTSPMRQCVIEESLVKNRYITLGRRKRSKPKLGEELSR